MAATAPSPQNSTADTQVGDTAISDSTNSPQIVVGIDGSKGSVAALVWAMAEAELRGARVTAVYAWTYPYASGIDVVGYVVGADEYQTMHQRVFESALQTAVPDDASRAQIERKLICQAPAAALIEIGKHAELTVVGARGHGGFLGLILGSVSTQVVNHSEGTVVVVR